LDQRTSASTLTTNILRAKGECASEKQENAFPRWFQHKIPEIPEQCLRALNIAEPAEIRFRPIVFSARGDDALNPWARLPIPEVLFPGCAHHYFRDGRRIAMLPEGFIHSSKTIVLVPRKD